MKKRLTLLLTDEQIHDIKVKAAMAGMPANAWIIEQLNIDTAHVDAAQEIQPDPEPVEQMPVDAVAAPVADDTAEQIHVDAQADAAALGAVVPDCAGRKIDIVERDNILFALDAALPGRNNAQARVDLLNKKQVPVYTDSKNRGVWKDPHHLSSNLTAAKKREAKRQAAKVPAE
jgi:hypothetical protein